jgi:hypothetical protein
MDEQPPDDPFRHMARFLTDWLAGARFREILHLVHLIRAELTRRGITFLWFVRQSGSHEARCPGDKHRAGV